MSHISRLHTFLASLFIFAATMMTFINAVNADFVNWDDDVYVTQNPYVQSPSIHNVEWMWSHTYYYAWIPLTLSSHALDVALWGKNPRGHHFTNVVLHSLNAVMFFLVGILVITAAKTGTVTKNARMSQPAVSVVVGSLIAALLFALHPLRVESTAWVSGRKDLLCALFLLPSFGAYVSWKTRRKSSWLYVSIILFALALLSKPIAMAFPVILILADVWLIQRNAGSQISLRDLFADKIAFILLGAMAAILTMLAAGEGKENAVGAFNLIERSLLPAYMFVFYIVKLLVPVSLSPIYPELNKMLLYASPFLILGGLYGCLLLLKRDLGVVVLALLSYALMLLPTFLGISSGLQPLADRYAYLPTISIFLLIGGVVELFWRKSAASPGKEFQRKFLFGILLVLCAVSSYRSVRQVAVWKNSVSLWMQPLRYAPASRQDYDRRRPYMKPDYSDAMINLGTAYYAAGNREKAAEQFNGALTLDPCSASAHYNLGNLLFEKGDGAKSMESFRRAIACDPLYAKAYFNIGILLAKQDSLEAAVQSFQIAARLGFAEAQKVLKERGYGW